MRRKANDCNDALIIIWKHGHKHGRAQQQQKMAVRFDSLLASPGEELFELCLARKNKVETNKKKTEQILLKCLLFLSLETMTIKRDLAGRRRGTSLCK